MTNSKTNKITNQTFTFKDGRTVNRLGYGAMRLTGQPGNFGPYGDWTAGQTLLRTAVDHGVDFIDTAHAYGPRWNERLVASALDGYADHVFIATKGGIHKRGPSAADITADGRPETLRYQIEESRRHLKRDVIDLYYLHRPDPKVRFADSISALESARQNGEIARIGVSNVTLDQLREAMRIAPISAVQNRFNPQDGGDQEVLEFTTKHGIAFVPWGPLGAHPLKPGSPFAASQGLGVQGAIQALPIPGTTSIDHLLENLSVTAPLAA
ncbi:MAG: aldo/keto reductase [Alphaproteobacteria bacterium]|nr:aldo/keto reductase [Alphaproteobacteria bacterium SS10]